MKFPRIRGARRRREAMGCQHGHAIAECPDMRCQGQENTVDTIAHWLACQLPIVSPDESAASRQAKVLAVDVDDMMGALRLVASSKQMDEDVMELVDAARQLVKFEREMRLWRERGEIATEAFIKSLENRSERLLDALAVATHKVAERSRGETAPAPTKDQYAAVCRERDEAREVAKAAVALLDARYLLDEDYERGEDGWFLPADRIRLRDEMLRKAKR